MAELTRRTILIVEDEEKIMRLLADHLSLAGYDVHAEMSGQEGLSYALEHHPHLVILDLRLPDISGYEVCRQLRQQPYAWAVPVLMVTALNQPIDKLRGYAYGADAYVTKPFELTDILQTVALLLGKDATN